MKRIFTISVAAVMALIMALLEIPDPLTGRTVL